MVIGVSIPTMIILGHTGYNIKVSTLSKNINTSGVSTKGFNFSQLIFSILVVNILSFTLWTLVLIFGQMHFFLSGWIWDKIPNYSVNPFAHYAFVNIIYINQVTGLIAFSTYYIVKELTNTKKKYYMVVMIILILGIIFGGSLNTYFANPHNYQVIDVLHIERPEGSYFEIDYSTNSIYINETFLNVIDGPTTYGEHGVEPFGGLFPNFMFIPSFLYPFFGIGQFSTAAITGQSAQVSNYMLGFDIYLYDNSIGEVIELIGPYNLRESYPWYEWFTISFKGTSWMWTITLLQPFILSGAYFAIGKSLCGFRNTKNK